jgi:UDP-N-acetylmuramoylalanine--D-glutamate ligase
MKLNLNQFYGKIIKYKSINEIKNLIKSEIQEGDTVLFSCGGASFNDFKNYKDRGKFFKNIVKEIENET